MRVALLSCRSRVGAWPACLARRHGEPLGKDRVRQTRRGARWKGERIHQGPHYLFRIAFGAENNLTWIGWGGNKVAGDEEGVFTSEGDYIGRWLHVAEVLDGDTIQAYVDFEPVQAIDAFNGHDGADPKPLRAPYNIFDDQPIRMGMS